MKLEAMNRQGQRTDLTFSQVGTKLNSVQELAENTGDSKSQIYRYIRLTHLVPGLLKLVDAGNIKMSPAVEISYLNESFQHVLLDAINLEISTPSHAQAIRLHEAFDEGTLTKDDIYSIMQEEKGNQKEKFTIQAEKINQYLPKNMKKSKQKITFARLWSITVSSLKEKKTVKAGS